MHDVIGNDDHVVALTTVRAEREGRTLGVPLMGDTQAGALAAGLLAEVDQILRDANEAALAYIQREAGYVHTGSHVTRAGGRESGQFREADLAVASWHQHTSRDGDMQLHTHNQIAHAACTRHDGQWRAPDSTAYYEHARAAGQVASVHEEAAPTGRFGLDWVPRADGMGFGIGGVGADLVDVFSHRRDVIDQKLYGELAARFWAAYGRPPNQRELASLMDQANLRTRQGKVGVIDWDAAMRGWQAKAAQKAGVDLRPCTGACRVRGDHSPRPRCTVGGVVPGQLGQSFCGPAGGRDCAAKISVACDRAERGYTSVALLGACFGAG